MMFQMAIGLLKLKEKYLRKLTRIPNGKVKITSVTTDFICELKDITTIAKCCCIFSKEILKE